MQNLQFPIGKFQMPEIVSSELKNNWLNDIKNLPENVKKAIANFSETDFHKKYRENGWTKLQVIHHLADSHINSFIRVKLALTEENPTIKPYEEQLWAELPDTKLPYHLSLQILEALHAKWFYLLTNLSETDLQKTFYHPAAQKQTAVLECIGLYAWHGNHHVAHLQLNGL